MDVGSSMAAEQKEVVLTRVLNAPRDLVYKVWTDPKHLAQWWGPHNFTNPVCEIDVRPGGAILVHMRWPDGRIHIMTGVFDEVVPQERLVFSSSVPDENGLTMFEVQTTVEFHEEKGKTKQIVRARVLKSTPQAAPYLAGMEPGWTQSLERLTDYVAKVRAGL